MAQLISWLVTGWSLPCHPFYPLPRTTGTRPVMIPTLPCPTNAERLAALPLPDTIFMQPEKADLGPCTRAPAFMLLE